MHVRFIAAAALAGAAVAVLSPAAAEAAPVIVARTGITSFNLPDFSSINSSTVAINDARQAAIKVGVVGGTGGAAGLFYGSYAGGVGTGGIVHTTAAGNVISDADLNDLGAAAFYNLDTGRLWAYDPVNGDRSINFPLGISGISGVNLTNAGRVGGRLDVGFSGDVFGTFDQQTSGNPALTTWAVDSGVDGGSPYSFLFTPDFAQDAARAGSKVMLAAGGNQIRRFADDATSALIASDRQADAASPYQSFGNGVAISDDGTKLTFQARLFGTSNDAIVLYDAADGSLTTVAAEGSGGISVLDAFAADVNDAGQVVFRGDAGDGSAVFLWDGGTITRVAGVGDQIETDLGLRQLGRRDGQSSQGGMPRINNLGDVAYTFQYFDPADINSVADGTLVLVTVVPEPTSAVMALAGGGLLALRRRRR